MKLFSALILSLSLLSTAALAETSMYGLTLGQSTLNEVKQHYVLTNKTHTDVPADNWYYYKVSGDQFNGPDIEYASLFFDDEQVLGGMWFYARTSGPTFNQVKHHLNQRYRGTVIQEGMPFAIYEDKDTEVTLMQNRLSGLNVLYLDRDYKDEVKAQKKAANANQSAAKKPIRKPPHDDDQ